MIKRPRAIKTLLMRILLLLSPISFASPAPTYNFSAYSGINPNTYGYARASQPLIHALFAPTTQNPFKQAYAFYYTPKTLKTLRQCKALLMAPAELDHNPQTQ